MTIVFCKECNNMLYPKEDKDQKTLFLTCRNCEHFEESKSNIICDMKFSKNKESTLSSLNKDLVQDKTLPRTNKVHCKGCNGNEAVYFQTKDRQEEVLEIHFVCCYCHEMWSANKMY